MPRRLYSLFGTWESRSLNSRLRKYWRGEDSAGSSVLLLRGLEGNVGTWNPSPLSTLYTLSRNFSSSLFACYSSFWFFFPWIDTYKVVMHYGELLSESLIFLTCCGEVLAPELICIPVWLSCCPELAAVERDCAATLWKCWALYACGTNMLTTTYLCCFFLFLSSATFPLCVCLCVRIRTGHFWGPVT